MKLLRPTLLAALLATSHFSIAADGEIAYETGEDERLEPGKTVKDRLHPEFEPIGLRLGTFLLFPEVRLKESYDDNIYYDDGNGRHDWITTLSPSVRLDSDWSRHSLKLALSVDSSHYDHYSGEDNDRIQLSTTGKLDITDHSFVTLRAEMISDTEDRGSPDDANGIEPAQTSTDEIDLAFEHRPARFFLKGHANFRRLDFDNVKTSLGTTVTNDDRDRQEDEISLTAGYEITREYDAFIRYTHGNRDYRLARDDNGYNRDSTSDALLVGAELDLSGVILGEVALGTLRAEYDDPRFNDTDGINAKALLFWHATPLTTVTGQLERSVAETTIAASSGFLSDTMAVSVYHELLRNLVLEASLSYTRNDYDNLAREDDVSSLSLSAEYKANRNLIFGVELNHGERDSTVAGADYRSNAVSLWAGLRY